MPKQNRVMPDGQIIATPARGLFMGNRGILHNEHEEIVQPYAYKMWIICQLSFKGRQRKLMQPGRYTELFFLDEATALAAGHRPCFECRRAAAEAFRTAWLAGKSQLNSVKAGEMDAILHAERLTDDYYKKDKKQRTFTAVFDTLPNGTFIHYAGKHHLLWEDGLFPWEPAGYGPPIRRPRGELVLVLTPPSTVAALAEGYVPVVHDTLSL